MTSWQEAPTGVDIAILADAISVLSCLDGAGARLALEQIRHRYLSAVRAPEVGV